MCSLQELAIDCLDPIVEFLPRINQVAQLLDTSIIPPFIPILFWLLAVFSCYWATISATSFFVLEMALFSSKIFDTRTALDLAN